MDMFPSQGTIADRYNEVVYANQIEAFRSILAKAKKLIDGKIVIPSHGDVEQFRKNLSLALKIINLSVTECRDARIGLKHNYRWSRVFSIVGVIVTTVLCFFAVVSCIQSPIPLNYAWAVFVCISEIVSIALLILSVFEKQKTATLRRVEKRSEITDTRIPWVLVQKLLDIINAYHVRISAPSIDEVVIKVKE